MILEQSAPRRLRQTLLNTMLIPLLSRRSGPTTSTRVREQRYPRCGNARLMLQIDMGVGDAVWPAATRCVYPTLFEFAAPEIFAYPREAVVAEKFEAMVVPGDRNSRIKDFFDLYYPANESQLDRVTLAESVLRKAPRPADIFTTRRPLF
jgi:hypothetical protein